MKNYIIVFLVILIDSSPWAMADFSNSIPASMPTVFAAKSALLFTETEITLQFHMEADSLMNNVGLFLRPSQRTTNSPVNKRLVWQLFGLELLFDKSVI